MTKISPAQQAENLRRFFNSSVNTVTRERIFFDRLSFDLKIAAARADYHLHIYEPDVDRDGFDIVVEDQENGLGWFQLKAVLRSGSTSYWETTANFLRPSYDVGEAMSVEPMGCGRGGGVILIEIDDATATGDVTYSYTDFRIMTALAECYMVEATPPKGGKGRPKKLRADAARDILAAVLTGARSDAIHLPRAVFVEAKSPDALLALMGLMNTEEYGAFAVQQAYGKVHVDRTGEGRVDDYSINTLGILRSHMTSLVAILSDREDLKPLTFISPYSSSTSV